MSNKKKTQALNSLYPQFETQPGIGGGLYHTGVARPFTNTGNTPSTPGSTDDAYFKEIARLKRENPDVSESTIRQQVKGRFNQSNQQPQMDEDMLQAFAQLYAMGGAFDPSQYRG